MKIRNVLIAVVCIFALSFGQSVSAQCNGKECQVRPLAKAVEAVEKVVNVVPNVIHAALPPYNRNYIRVQTYVSYQTRVDAWGRFYTVPVYVQRSVPTLRSQCNCR